MSYVLGLSGVLMATISLLFFGPTARVHGQPGAPPKLYGFCMEMPAVQNPSIRDQAALLRELGFDGAGYALWLGDQLDTNLRVLDQAGLQLDLVYLTVNLDRREPAFDPRVPKALAKLN